MTSLSQSVQHTSSCPRSVLSLNVNILLVRDHSRSGLSQDELSSKVKALQKSTVYQRSVLSIILQKCQQRYLCVISILPLIHKLWDTYSWDCRTPNHIEIYHIIFYLPFKRKKEKAQLLLFFILIHYCCLLLYPTSEATVLWYQQSGRNCSEGVNSSFLSFAFPKVMIRAVVQIVSFIDTNNFRILD